MNSPQSLVTKKGAWLGCDSTTSTSWRWLKAPVWPRTALDPSSHRVASKYAVTLFGSLSLSLQPVAARAASFTSASL